MSGQFCWYELRTTDPDAARRFYAEVAAWSGPVVALPERARARGAPSHWLGHIAVSDLEGSAGRFAAAGAQLLVPPDERGVAVLRDPQGAVVALSAPPGPDTGPGIGWHELHTTDHERAWSVYSTLFGWRVTEIAEGGAAIGPYAMFSWADGGRSVGGMASTAARSPSIHTHWLFYLAVPDLDAALAKVRALGGLALGALDNPAGHRVSACEDPQGAAFGLLESQIPGTRA